MFFQDGSRSVENETTLITWDPNRSPKKRCPHRPHGPPVVLLNSRKCDETSQHSHPYLHGNLRVAHLPKNHLTYFPPKKYIACSLRIMVVHMWPPLRGSRASFPNGGRCHWGFTLLGDLWRYLATHRPRRHGSRDGWSAFRREQTLRCVLAFDHGKGGWLFLTLTGIFGASFSGMMIWYLLEIWGQNSIQAQIPIRKCQCIMTYQWYVMILPVIVYQWNCLFQGVTMTNSSPQFPKDFKCQKKWKRWWRKQNQDDRKSWGQALLGIDNPYHPWDWYILPTLMVDSYSKCRNKYTSPMVFLWVELTNLKRN